MPRHTLKIYSDPDPMFEIEHGDACDRSNCGITQLIDEAGLDEFIDWRALPEGDHSITYWHDLMRNYTGAAEFSNGIVLTPVQWDMWGYDEGGRFTAIATDRRYAEHHGLPHPIVRLDVREVSRDEGTHWGWIKEGATEPVMIWDSWACFTICFPYGPEAEERRGKGLIVRLDVRAA